MKQQKPIILFLIKFFVTYFLLFALYAVYLKKTQVKVVPFSCAPITKTVAQHSQSLAQFLGYHLNVKQYDKELAVDIYVGNQLTAKVIEGCNGFSIIILFISFIIAFSGKALTTFLFAIFGSFIIYLVNIVRIVLLSLFLYKYPEYQSVLHKLVFPAIIYGITFLLWVIWVRKFSKHSKNNA